MKRAIIKSATSLGKVLPLIAGTVLLVGLMNVLIPKSFYLALFHNNTALDSLIGTIIGSISAGTPITSYILGGELLNQGVSLIAVTAFLVAWVTVGVIQLPAEMVILGKKFALLRNATAFILATVVATITVFILKLI